MVVEKPWLALMGEPLAQVSSASSQEKWKYESYNVSIASERWDRGWWVGIGMTAVHMAPVLDGCRKALVDIDGRTLSSSFQC